MCRLKDCGFIYVGDLLRNIVCLTKGANMVETTAKFKCGFRCFTCVCHGEVKRTEQRELNIWLTFIKGAGKN